MADILKEKGNEAFKAQNFTEADRLYASAAQLDPSNAVLYSNRAMTLIKLSDWKTCLSVCEKGLKCTTDGKTNVKLLWRRGIAQSELKDFKSARESYQQALTIDPKNSMVLKSLQEMKSSESKFKRSHSIDEKSPEKRPKMIEPIEIYEVDELPAEFRGDNPASTKTPQSTSTPSTSGLSRPLLHESTSTIQPSKQANPTQSSIDPIVPQHSLTSFSTSPTLHQIAPIIKSPSPQTFDYVFSLSPEVLGKLFGTGCIEPAVLNFILDASIHALKSNPTQENALKAVELLNTFSSVPRFSLVSLFCDKDKLGTIARLLSDSPVDNGVVADTLSKWN